MDATRRLRDSLRLVPGPLAGAFEASAAAAASAAQGLWRAAPSTWSADPAVQQKIANRLGWMRSPALMANNANRILQFANGIKRDGFTDVVLLGMGGSSLAPEVLRAVLGVADGWPRFPTACIPCSPGQPGRRHQPGTSPTKVIPFSQQHPGLRPQNSTVTSVFSII